MVTVDRLIVSSLEVHLASGSKFDFQKYIKRSLQDDLMAWSWESGNVTIVL
jgi:hypothetical protein